MNFIDDGTDEKKYKRINQNIIDGNVMNISLIVIEVNYGDIDADDYICHGCYIIRFSSTPYTLQSELSIYGQVISFGEMVCEGTFFQSISIIILIFLQKINPITQLYI